MTGIYGMSGSGKTGVTKIMVEEAVLQDIPSFIISPARDFYTLLKRKSDDERAQQLEQKLNVLPLSFSDETQIPIHFPLFNLPTREEVQDLGLSSADLDLTFEKIASAYVNIAHATESRNRMQQFTIFFNQLIKEAYEREIVVNSIESLQQLVTSDLSYGILKRLGLDRLKRNLVLGIENIKTGQTKYLFDYGWPLDFDIFLNTENNKTDVNILDIADFNLDDQNKIVGTFCDILLNWGVAKGLTKKIRVILVIDEAHNFCPKGNRITAGKRPIERLVREGRKYGIVCILASQLPRDLDNGVRSNLGIICMGKSVRDEIKEVHKDIEGRTEQTIDIDQLYSLESREFVWADSDNIDFFYSRDLYTEFDKVDQKLISEASKGVKEILPPMPERRKELSLDMSKLKSDIVEDPEVLREVQREHKIETLYLKSNKEVDLKNQLKDVIMESSYDIEIDESYFIYLPFLLGKTHVKINSQPTFESNGKEMSPFPTSIFDVHILEGLKKILDLGEHKINQDRELPGELWIMNTQLSELDHYTKDDKANLKSNLDRKLPKSLEYHPTGLTEILESETLQRSLVINELKQQVMNYLGNLDTSHVPPTRENVKTLSGNTKVKQKLTALIREYKQLTGGVSKSLLEKRYEDTLMKTVEWKRKVEKLKEMGKYDSYYKDVTKKRLQEYDTIKNKIDRVNRLENEIQGLKQHLQNPTTPPVKKKKNQPSQIDYISKLQSWNVDDSDSIDSLEFDIINIPFMLLVGSYDEKPIIGMLETFKGSFLYISCNYCLRNKGMNDNQLHDIVWECADSDCGKLLCDYHSKTSNYSERHLCEEHQAQCDQCGLVELEVLEICEDCGDEFCPNHIELVPKRFKRDELLCVNCRSK